MLPAHRCTILQRDLILSQMQSLFDFCVMQNALVQRLRRSFSEGAEVQSELYVALDEGYISSEEFNETYKLVGRTRAAIRGFINYLKKYNKQNVSNREP